MAQAAAHLVDPVSPHVPVVQWVLIGVMSAPRPTTYVVRPPRESSKVAKQHLLVRLPIPLRLLLAAQPKLVTPVLQVVQHVMTRFLLEQAGLKADEADSSAVTLIQPNFHDRVGRQPEHSPALPGAGRRVPTGCRRRACSGARADG